MKTRTRIATVCLALGFWAMGAAAQVAEAAAPKPLAAQTTRDSRGVWFITGDSIPDVFDAMGYAIAKDRLWQTELYFRSGTGRLSEIFGASQLPTDMYVRTTGYTQKELKKGFKKLSKDAQDIIDSYTRGFNRRVDEVLADPSQIPFEYLALSAQFGTTFRPQHWTRYDVMSWLVLLQREFDAEAMDIGQLENYVILQTLEGYYPSSALAMFSDMRWINDPEALTYIPSGAGHQPVTPFSEQEAILRNQLAAIPAGALEPARKTVTTVHDVIENLKKINAYVHMGSYAWVISGDRTADGNPIIYSGPQMGFTVPSITAEGSIKCPTLNISGMTVPGIPLIIIGRTPHHAWSMQVGHAHTTDYYVESPLAAKLHHKTIIKVFGGADVKLKVYRTSHGPVINPMPYDLLNLDDVTVSWKNSHWMHEWEALDGFLQMARATSMDQFGAGIQKICVSQHFCYADKDGNIAYWMSGWDPIRSANVDPRLPSPGDFQHEWTGQFRPLSTDRNTSQGYYCGWNNKSAADYINAPNNINYNFGPFHGAHVVNDYLSTHTDLTFEQVRDLALNIATTDSFAIRRGVPWSQVGPYFTAAVQAYPNPNRLAFLGMVQAWDGHFVAGGPTQWALGQTAADPWVIEEKWIGNMIKLTFTDELGPDVVHPDMQFLNMLIHGLEGSSSGVPWYFNWFADHAGVGLPTDPQLLIVTALDMTMQELGAPPYNQPRGVITYTHDLLGPIHTMPYSNRSTYAHCVEYSSAGPIRVESMFPLGESGFIGMSGQGAPVFDPNFFSMAPNFDTFTLRDFPPPQ